MLLRPAGCLGARLLLPARRPSASSQRWARPSSPPGRANPERPPHSVRPGHRPGSRSFPFLPGQLGTSLSKLPRCPPRSLTPPSHRPGAQRGLGARGAARRGLANAEGWLMPRVPLSRAGSSRAGSVLHGGNSQEHTKWYLQLFPERWYFSYQCSTFYPISLKYSLEAFLLE